MPEVDALISRLRDRAYEGSGTTNRGLFREAADALEKLAKENAALRGPARVVCPNCGGDDVIRIHAPEAYEFSFKCRKCDKGFN